MAADPADDLPAPPKVPATALATLDADRLAPAEMAATLRFAAAAKAPNTRRAYAADWADFCRWAAARGASPPALPARPRVQLPRHPGRGRPPRLDHRPSRRRDRAHAPRRWVRLTQHQSRGARGAARHPPHARHGSPEQDPGHRRPDRPHACRLPYHAHRPA